MVMIRKGLDLPIEGVPTSELVPAAKVTRVALLGTDFVGMKPSMKVGVGDRVKIGSPLFECKKVPGVIYTSPGSGTIKEISRGEKRVFQSIVIELDEKEDYEEFPRFERSQLKELSSKEVIPILQRSGVWSSFKTRPFSKAPAIDSLPHSIFVTAMDSNPLKLDVSLTLDKHAKAFCDGVEVLSALTQTSVHICTDHGRDLKLSTNPKVLVHEFGGVHPAGLAGTHIHYIDPVGPQKMVWSINHQDVISIGYLFTTGRLWVERVVAFGGPKAKNPKHFITRVGACISELLAQQYNDPQLRVVSGSVLNGRHAQGPFDYLGYFHQQIAVLEEGKFREFMGWMNPGADRFSVKRTFLSSWLPARRFSMNTNLYGGVRAMVPIGVYEKLVPLEILPTQLLRSLFIGDTEDAQRLGCLELDEEDLALCTYADPGKVDYGPLLRNVLTTIEKEG